MVWDGPEHQREDVAGVAPKHIKPCLTLELYKAKRTIEGLEYALWNAIPYDDRKIKNGIF